METAREKRERRERLDLRDHEEKVHGGEACPNARFRKAGRTYDTGYCDGFKDALTQTLGQFALHGPAGLVEWLRNNAPPETHNIVSRLETLLSTKEG